jgi:uncharacterized protein (DUF849 family)
MTIYFTDDALLPENQEPLIITVAPFGPLWLPSDYSEDITVSWDTQVQKAAGCYNAGDTVRHVHVRELKTGRYLEELSWVQRFYWASAAGRAEDDRPDRWLDLL